MRNWRNIKPFLNVSNSITLVLIFCMACSSAKLVPTKNGQNQSESEATIDVIGEYGFGAALTGDKDYGSIIVHENGEQIITMTQTDPDGNILAVVGSIWISQVGDTLVVFSDTRGYPEKAVMGDFVFLFSNYTANSVDITRITPDGTREIHENIPVNLDPLSGIPYSEIASLDDSFLISESLSLWDTVVHASFSLSIAGCGVAIIMTAGAAGLLCASAIITGITLYMQDTNQDPNAGLMASGLALGTLGCGTGDVPSCVSTAIQTADVMVKSAETKIQEASLEAKGEVSSSAVEDQPGLTDEEKANAGKRVYNWVCNQINELPQDETGYGYPCPEVDEGTVELEISFDLSAHMVYISFPLYLDRYTRVGKNQYQVGGVQGSYCIITFYLDGFLQICGLLDPQLELREMRYYLND